MIERFLTPALALAAFAVAAAPAPALARMHAPGLNDAAPAAAEQVHYRRYWHRHHHWRRHRHCWTHRYRVRIGHGRFIVKSVRRCGWR